ncbi:amidase family protein [uncultured Tenacibaculum sp.]|uniref:amidase family protein n=1 Tax=uncultured Tenacibaculum sp. TaxID=174713 RepID=UPI00263197AB|nr:amidase family protein [uncultured Tenacibaculum sp.]
MHKICYVLLVILLIGCKAKKEEVAQDFTIYNEATEVKDQQAHENPRMKFKLIQSKVLDMNEVFKPFQNELSKFSEEDYLSLKPLILEKSIPSIQKAIKEGKLSYENLTLFYLYRIRKFESDSTKYLNAIINLNPNVVEEARQKDKVIKEKNISVESIFGMPILLKDNINTDNLPTTAGALALKDNATGNAFIVEKLKENGALILGKVNLSEWAYYFCTGCPLGYSAIGGQTLNPYGRKVFETGGSSAGSGVATAANYAVATIGTETAGSITSPSSQNSVVGLKPTIGILSRSGIVPISSTLDTPGPMTKSVIDNFILFKAMLGLDATDKKSKEFNDIAEELHSTELKSKRFGVFTSLLEDPVYKETIDKLKEAGVEIIELSPDEASLDGFLTLLNIDMKYDLPHYLKGKSVAVASVEDVINFNKKESLVRAPYGQQLFEGIVKDTTSLEELEKVKSNLMANSRAYFTAFETDNLDAILSINNYHSAYSAVAEYPNLTIPMGYKETGEPMNLTLIGKPKSEFTLLSLGLSIENLTKIRKLPKGYE